MVKLTTFVIFGSILLGYVLSKSTTETTDVTKLPSNNTDCKLFFPIGFILFKNSFLVVPNSTTAKPSTQKKQRNNGSSKQHKTTTSAPKPSGDSPWTPRKSPKRSVDQSPSRMEPMSIHSNPNPLNFSLLAVILVTFLALRP